MQELTLLMEAEYHSRRIVATLATVDAQGFPRARTVIVRHLDAHDGSIWITTDARSAKIEELTACPGAELVFWTPNERQQFRVRGLVEIVWGGTRRLEVWHTLSDPSKGTFYGPPPGALRQPGGRVVSPVPPGGDPPECFVLLVLRPTHAEALELNESPHRRRRWKAELGWDVELINP